MYAAGGDLLPPVHTQQQEPPDTHTPVHHAPGTDHVLSVGAEGPSSKQITEEAGRAVLEAVDEISEEAGRAVLEAEWLCISMRLMALHHHWEALVQYCKTQSGM